MRLVSLFLIIVFLVLLGKGVFGYSLVVPFIFAFVFAMQAKLSFFVAFLSGVIMGLVAGTNLGRESLALVISAGVIQLYARRFSAKHVAFFVGFTGIGSVIYSLVVGRSFGVFGVLIDMVMVIIFLPVVLWWKRVFLSEDIVLRI